MEALVRRLAPQLEGAPVRLSVILPGGGHLGPQDADVTLWFHAWSSLGSMAAGQVGKVAQDVVEGRVELEGRMRDVMEAAAWLLPGTPVTGPAPWWAEVVRRARSLVVHTREQDARQIRFHYDVGDDFYALWLDPRRVYSCAYYRSPELSLAQAQEAKLDHICRKLLLRPGDRFLDIGAGWGGLLLWAAEHYGVRGQGITLSRNQHRHVNRLIEEKGLQGRVRMDLVDYRDLDESDPYDKIASVGMFEHVGQAMLPAYFGKVLRLLRPGGLVMNHGISAGGPATGQLGAGMGEFIEKYIFPGGELEHVSHVLREMAQSTLEVLDVENLRPHYARTLWAWSDALEARLEPARQVLQAQAGAERAGRILRAYRLYLAGCAMCFERGWLSLHQILAARPDGDMGAGALRGAQSGYPFNRGYMYS